MCDMCKYIMKKKPVNIELNSFSRIVKLERKIKEINKLAEEIIEIISKK